MIEILYSVLGLGGLAILIWIVRSIKKWGGAESKQEQAEKERDDALEKQKDMANRPRTLNDRIVRLQDWKRKL